MLEMISDSSDAPSVEPSSGVPCTSIGGKKRLPLPELTLNTFSDTSGKALVQSVKSILADDPPSQTSRNRSQALVETFTPLFDEAKPSSALGHHDVRKSSNDHGNYPGHDSSLANKSDGQHWSVWGAPALAHDSFQEPIGSPRRANAASELRTIEEDSLLDESSLTKAVSGDRGDQHPGNDGKSSRCAPQKPESFCPEHHELHDQFGPPPYEVDMWYSWASHVSQLLTVFSNELVSVGSRLESITEQLQCIKLGVPRLPSADEETPLVEDTRVDDSKKCDGVHDVCAVQLSALTSRLDALEQSLKTCHRQRSEGTSSTETQPARGDPALRLGTKCDMAESVLSRLQSSSSSLLCATTILSRTSSAASFWSNHYENQDETQSFKCSAHPTLDGTGHLDKLLAELSREHQKRSRHLALFQEQSRLRLCQRELFAQTGDSESTEGVSMREPSLPCGSTYELTQTSPDIDPICGPWRSSNRHGKVPRN